MADPLPWTYDDGGRRAASFKGDTGDCVVRAIAIATGLDYRQVYDDLFDRARAWNARRPKRLRDNASPRTGVYRDVYEPYLTVDLGWEWTPTMQIGSGCQVHLAIGELPDQGPLVVSLSRHIAAVVDGWVHDTDDPTRGGTRCVYGYYSPGPEGWRR